MLRRAGDTRKPAQRIPSCKTPSCPSQSSKEGTSTTRCPLQIGQCVSFDTIYNCNCRVLTIEMKEYILPVASGKRTHPNKCSIHARQYRETVCASASAGQWPKCCRSQLIGTPEVRVLGPASGSSTPRNPSTRSLQPSDLHWPVIARPLILRPRIFWTSCSVTVISPQGR